MLSQTITTVDAASDLLRVYRPRTLSTLRADGTVLVWRPTRDRRGREGWSESFADVVKHAERLRQRLAFAHDSIARNSERVYSLKSERVSLTAEIERVHAERSLLGDTASEFLLSALDHAVTKREARISEIEEELREAQRNLVKAIERLSYRQRSE